MYDWRRGIRDDSINRLESRSTRCGCNMDPRNPSIFKRWKELSKKRIHLGPDEPCADHCTVFALSDPVEEKFSGECCYDYNQACPECKGIVDVLKAIEDTLRNGDLDLNERQKERARWDLDNSVSSIDAWKAHLLRTFQQDQARQDTLDRLDDQTIMVINDWAMKLLPCASEKRSLNGSPSAELAGTFLRLFTNQTILTVR